MTSLCNAVNDPPLLVFQSIDYALKQGANHKPVVSRRFPVFWMAASSRFGWPLLLVLSALHCVLFLTTLGALLLCRISARRSRNALCFGRSSKQLVASLPWSCRCSLRGVGARSVAKWAIDLYVIFADPPIGVCINWLVVHRDLIDSWWGFSAQYVIASWLLLFVGIGIGVLWDDHRKVRALRSAS